MMGKCAHQLSDDWEIHLLFIFTCNKYFCGILYKNEVKGLIKQHRIMAVFDLGRKEVVNIDPNHCPLIVNFFFY